MLKGENSICPDCLRPYTPRIIELGGRIEDYLFSPEKGWIRPAIVTYPLKSLQAVREMQFLQREKNRIRIRYTIDPSGIKNLEKDLQSIRSGLFGIFGRDMDIRLEEVDDFKRGATGKYKWIVNEMEDNPIIRNDG